MSKFYLWILRKYLMAEKVDKNETLVIALRSEVSREELEDMSRALRGILGDRVVLIGDVDKIIVAN